MESIINVNWDTVDYDKLHADYITMPDGTRRLIEMSMIHWYAVDFMTKNSPTSLNETIQSTLDLALEDNGSIEEFDDLFRTALIAWSRGWIQGTEGR